MKFYSLFLASSFLTFTLTFNFALYCTCFTSSCTKTITKLKKGVGQPKPPAAKLAIVKNTSSKLKRRSHRISSKLEFSNTQDNPIDIEEAEEEVLMHIEEIVFTDESKKQGSLAAFEGGHSFNDLSESEDDHFFSWLGLHWANSSSSFTFNSSSEHFISLFPSIYRLLFSLPLFFTGLSLFHLAS